MKILIAFLLLCGSAVAATPQEATGRVGAGTCSCVIISPIGLALTAEHCGIRPGNVITVGGNKYRVASITYEPPKNNTDEAVLLQLSGAETYPWVSVSGTLPRVGDRVFSLGYPGGKWSRSEGVIVGLSNESIGIGSFLTSYAIHTNFGSAGGGSGGPLFNADGAVIGLTSTTSVEGSNFIGLQSIQRATRGKVQKTEINPDKPDLVVFSRVNCAPCEALKDDVRGGAYAPWNVIFTQWDGTRWSTPWVYVDGRQELHAELSGNELHAEFMEKTKVGRHTSPAIWVRYTDKHYTGNRGLLAWLRGILGGIRNIIIGEPTPLPPETPFVPDPPPEPPPEPKKYERSPGSVIAGLKDELAGTKADIAKLIKDGKAFKDAGLIGKMAKLRGVKADVKRIEGRVDAIKGHWSELKNGFKDPRAMGGMLLSLAGWFYRRKREG